MIKKLLLANWRDLTLCAAACGLSIGELAMMVVLGTAYDPNVYIRIIEAVMFFWLIILSVAETVRIANKDA